MFWYVARRLVSGVPVLLGISVLTFALIKTVPGDAAIYLLGDWATYHDIAEMRHALGLDEPAPLQFARYLGRLATGDLGASLITKRPIAPELMTRAWLTLQVAALSLAMGAAVGVLIGTAAGVRRGSRSDRILVLVSLLGVSTPIFLTALILMYVFAFQLSLVPISGYSGPVSLILPSVTLATVVAGSIARVTRSSLIEALTQDYVRTARAKGLRERVVTLRHALRNSLLVVVTLVGLQFGYLLGGAVVTETIFALPGIGLYGLQAILQRDLPVIQAVVLFAGAAFTLINIATDVLYGFLDPKLRVR